MSGSRFEQPTSRVCSIADYQNIAPGRIAPESTLNSKFGVSLVLGVWFLALLFCPNARAQSYSIDWFTIDGGGGSSTGGVYAVSGTIGQPDAGAMSGGQYSLVGGFWALPIVVQTLGMPTLTIVPAAPDQATISWSPNTPGFVLQDTLSLSSANWSNSPSGATNPVTVPAALPKKFYRLFKP